jgi:ParB-like chromosome segregation protein Spo0J
MTKKLRQIEHIAVDALVPYARNSRTHSQEQISQVAASIREFGFTNPVLIDGQGGIIAGHGRVMAARQLGIAEVPCIRLAHLTEDQKRAYVIADNKLALNSEWDENLLDAELEILNDAGFDLTSVGFTDEELDLFEEASRSAGTATTIREIEVTAVRASFWISVRGPLEQQSHALQRLQTLMAEIPVTVEIGSVANGVG